MTGQMSDFETQAHNFNEGRKAHAAATSFPFTRALSPARKPSVTAALSEFKKAKQIEDTPLQLCEIGIAYAASGKNEDARNVLHEVIESSKQKHAPQHSYRIARIYASLREPDAAFKSLEKAFTEREENLVWMKVDPHLDNLRSDPRFVDLLRRVGLAP